MQKSIKTLLSLATVSPIFSIASPLTYPDDHKWTFSVGTDCGIETFYTRYVNQNPDDDGRSAVGDFYGSGLVFGLNQSFGYGKWFYIQAKESATIATNSMVPSDREDNRESRSKGVRFIDADIRAYFPLRLTKKNKLTLGPLIGFAVHSAHLKRQYESNTPTYKACVTQSFSPMLGLMLGFEPTERFSLRPVLAFEFPNFRQKTRLASNSGEIQGPMTKWDKLRMHRLSMNASLDMSYVLSEKINLTGSINYLGHALSDINDLNQNQARYDTNYSSRFQAKAGISWDF